jgi:mediator of replication checkpoint protein 1
MAPSSTPSSSPPASPQHHDTILTPSRKVRALLAQFNDSDSDQTPPMKNAATARSRVHSSESQGDNFVLNAQSLRSLGSAKHQGSEDEVVPGGPRGRLAAQMQTAPASAPFESSDEDTGAEAYARIKDQIEEMSKSKGKGQEAITNRSSGDELQRSFPRRRFLKKNSGSSGGHFSPQESRSPSPLFFPSASAGRSSAKASSKRISQEGSDSEELPEDPLKQGGSKFLALVEKHRKQRLARQAADEAKRAERLQQLKEAGSKGSLNVVAATLNGLSDESDVSDRDVGKRLTQQARPTRKASKKALDEMSRETQRMSRGMQLAHQAKIKKKITKDSLLARFNLPPPTSLVGHLKEACHASTTANSTPASDVEGAKEQKKPPTSPIAREKESEPDDKALAPPEAMGTLVPDEDEELPAMEDLCRSQPTAVCKGKAKAVAVDEVAEIPKKLVMTTKRPTAPLTRVSWSKRDAIIARGADSDSDLEIVTSNSKAKKIAAFEHFPQRKGRETNSHHILRSLAHLQTGTSENKHSSINAAELESHLRRAARMQARKEREEKLEELRAKGIFVQTTEERDKEKQEVEDLVEQARVEAAEIEQREKKIAKKDGTFVKDQLDDGDSEDEDDTDFCDENEEVEDHVSGSEEEEGQSEIDQEDDLETENDLNKRRGSDPQNTYMIVQHADAVLPEDHSRDTSLQKDNFETSEEAELPRRPARSRRALILSDDEDNEEVAVRGPSPPQTAKTPQSVLRSARKVIPGLQMSDDLPMGLTQAFAATMAESESQDEIILTQEQDFLSLTRDLPSPQFPQAPSLNRLESLDIITDSQPACQTQPLKLDLCLMPKESVPQSPAGMLSTQLSFVPTQDVGYVMSPFKDGRFDTPLPAPYSTIDTVIVPQEENSPILQRKGRLRRGRATPSSGDEAVDSEHRRSGLSVESSAFAVLKHAASRASDQNLFDKSRSHAKEVVDEAAEESEDEYAGLGGASDEDDGEEDEADRRMIDLDEKLGQGDEGKLAGFYA